MRVGLLIDRFEPERGGAERALARLARHLAARGHDVRAVARSGVELPGVRLERVHLGRAALAGRVRRERALGEALARRAEELSCDATLGIRHLPWVDLYWPHHGSHAGVLEARDRRARRPASARPTGRHALFLALEARLLAGAARRVVCVSRAVEAELRRVAPAAAPRLVLVENGVDLERFHPEDRERRGATLRSLFGDPAHPLLVFVARHPRDKGLPELARALARLRALPWRLLVVGARRGAAWRRRLRRTLAAAGPAEARVHVLERADPAALFAAADLTVVPTWRDACLGVALESLAAGTPVVTSVHSGVVEACDHPDAGTVVADPADEVALADALAGWLGRIGRGEVDRARVRARVATRGEGPWLERLEEELLRVASERSA